MLKKTIISSALVLFVVVACLAADLITGKWVGTINTPNGEFELTYTLKTEGDKLTGTISTGEGAQPIYDGKVNAENVSFKSNYNDMVVTHEGKVVGDTLKVKLSVEGNVMEGKFLRAKTD